MNRVDRIYEVTTKIWDLLNQEITAKSREATIEKLNDLILQRGTYMEELNPPYSKAEQQQGTELIKINDKIQVRLQALFSDLKLEMKQVKQQKKSNQSYTNPYKNIQTMDGMFMDSKK